uniref:Uncharacterized protein n=1 Tax=Pygocentrus nattereri TaxID=42514 RepID=A0AAR2KXY3_PYGNA
NEIMHSLCDLAMSNMRLNAAVRDAWGPPSSGLEPQTKTPPPSSPNKAPKRPHSTPKPHAESCYKGTVKIYTPLKTHMVDQSLQHSLHSIHPLSHPNKSRTVHIPLDPFREHGGFQLKTDTELEELIQTQAQLHHMPTHTAEDNERQCKTAWKLKIKGVPPNDYKKEDQVYAPELGEDTYI